MNELARRKLRELVARDGLLIAENSSRTESLLRDYCGEFRREISVLVMALEDTRLPICCPRRKVYQEKFCSDAWRKGCATIWLYRKAQRVGQSNSWALAFGLISENELSARRNRQTKKQNITQPTANRSPKVVKTSTPQATQQNQAASTQNAKVASASYVVSANGAEILRLLAKHCERFRTIHAF
jgi:hypothetical protein